MLFERTCTLEGDEKVSAADGRKVRWMLIYAIFQTLISVTQAPKDVKDTQDVSYPLCCQIPTTAPWKIGVFSIEDRPSETQIDKKFDIKPDIDYASSISSGSLLPSKSVQRAKSKRAPSPPSMRRMLSRTKTPTVQPPPPKRLPFCEILVHGYGNGLNPISTQVTEADVIYANTQETEQRVVQDDSTPSTPSSYRDSSGWDNSNASSDESLTDMDHISVDAGPVMPIIPKRLSSRRTSLVREKVFEAPVPLDLTKISE